MTRVMNTPYIEWAKLHQAASFNLAVSGMPHVSYDDIGGPPADMPITGSNAYGYAPLVEGLAHKHGVASAQVVTCTGCSMANYLALATLIAPGDEVLIERPTYEPLLRAAAHLGASVIRFDRPAAEHCRVDAARVIAAITPRTRLIVLANLHNPSSQVVSNDVLRAIGERAHEVGARVLVDEVYLDAAFDTSPQSCVHLDPVFIATGSLTKIYGLAALRCGWIIADERFARRAWQVADLLGNVQPFAPDWLAARALPHLPALRARARALLDANRATFERWAQARTDVSYLPVQHGTTICARPRDVDASTLCAELRARFDVSIVPGHFFEMPDYVRIGLPVEPVTFAEALTRLGACLDEIRQDAGDA
jgi:aspartate/methionine/tyrosine aminotransferase